MTLLYDGFLRFEHQDQYKQDIKDASKKIGDDGLLQDIIKSINWYLERNARICPTAPSTNVQIYKPKRILGGWDCSVHFYIRDNEIVVLCRFLLKKYKLFNSQ